MARRGWRGRLSELPLTGQMFALVAGTLVVAQLVTLLLTLILPPEAPARYGLGDIAAALRDEHSTAPALSRIVQSGPPDLSGNGWLVSEHSRAALAQALSVPADRVTLGFFTQMPFGGPVDALPTPRPKVQAPLAILTPRARPAAPHQFAASRVRRAPRPQPILAVSAVAMVSLIQAGPGAPTTGAPGSGPMPGGFPGVGLPGGGFPQSMPPMHMPPMAHPGGPTTREPRMPQGEPRVPRGEVHQPRGFDRSPDRARPLDRVPQPRLSTDVAPTALTLPEGTPRLALPIVQQIAPLAPVQHVPPVLRPTPLSVPHETITAAPAAQPEAPVSAATAAPAAAPPVTVAPAEKRAALPASHPIPVVHQARGLFGLAPAPFVEGDFVAGARLGDGRWVVVTPNAEGFPNAWQRRVLLWFALSLLLVAPFAWWLARRIVGPLQDFARAADTLGRDPSSTILPLDGPAEVGRAAHAFNQMLGRLRSFVEDRTAMIGAISHDLRTPLTRLRFRIEDVPEEQHAALLGEIVDMEAMISSVIAYMRDSSTPNARERLNLSEVVHEAVENAAMIGQDVRAEVSSLAPVDVDALGMRRVFENLLTNAAKYGGGRTTVSLRVEGSTAVAEIVDNGAGLPDSELERVFDPFFRGASAEASGRQGSGLGLAVCRSIARAHGGDVRLLRSERGFVARVTIPLAFDSERRMAA